MTVRALTSLDARRETGRPAPAVETREDAGDAVSAQLSVKALGDPREAVRSVRAVAPLAGRREALRPERAVEALAGRREAVRLEQPSVRHLADVLARRCREISWIRTAVASLDRFATLTGNDDLEALLERARHDPRVGADALLQFSAALPTATRSQVAALLIGPKLWLTLNGAHVPWCSLEGDDPTARDVMHGANPVDRLILLALIGSGLHRAELMRLKIGDVGRLDSAGALIADIDADPLAVRYVQRRDGVEYITFFTAQGRDALAYELDRRRTAGERLDTHSMLVAPNSGIRATTARASRFNASLIGAANLANVELCRKTGDFFRTWGQPGARFDASLVPPVEENV